MPTEDPLQPLLDEAEAKLHRRLHAACEAEAQGVASDSAIEIRRLEDSLLAAAMAAEQVLTVRRHMQRNAKAAQQSSGTAGEEQPSRSARTGEPMHGVAPAPSQPGKLPPEPARQEAAASAPAEQLPPREGVDQFGTTVREFTDCKGRTWRAWPVTPGSARAGQPSRRTLGEFQEGWICFESMDDSARRRLPRREARWSELRVEELERLLDQAITVPGRKPAAAHSHPDQDVRLH
jgi:hypothetical protein